MGRFKEKIQNFMYGRNGNDPLNNFFFILYLISLIAYIFCSKITPWNYILLGIETLLIIIIIWRFLSKNITKRSIANDRFVNLLKYIKRPFLRMAHRIRDRKTHIYKKCPNCKQILKLRKIKGEHTVKCPMCEHHFNIKI